MLLLYYNMIYICLLQHYGSKPRAARGAGRYFKFVENPLSFHAYNYDQCAHTL